MAETPPEQSGRFDIPIILQVLSAVLAPATALTALLYWFGWVRARTTFDYFGVDVSLLHLSTQQYILRSAEVAFRPLAVVLLLTLVLGAFGLVADAFGRLAPPGLLATGVCLLFASGALGLAYGLLTVEGAISLHMAGSPYVGPAALGLGAAAVAHALLLARTWLPTRSNLPSPQSSGSIDGTAALLRLAAGGVGLLAAFWAVTLHAQAFGARVAQSTASDLRSRPAVRVYAELPLGLEGPGVHVRQLPPGGRYKVCYAGLRILVHSGETLVLLPQEWTPFEGSVFFLSQADDMRLEVRRGDALPC